MLAARLDDFKVGDRVKLNLLRGSKALEVFVNLQAGG